MNRSGAAIALLAIAVGVAAVPAPAQRRGRIIIRPQTPPAPGPRGRYIDVDYPTPEKRAANLAEILGLTGEQTGKLKEVFAEQDKQTAAIWADESLTADARTRKINTVRDEAMKKVRDLLTDDQKKKYDAIGSEEKPPAVK